MKTIHCSESLNTLKSHSESANVYRQYISFSFHCHSFHCIVSFTTSVFQDSTCQSETGSTASHSLYRADRWSWCTGQICCEKEKREAASGYDCKWDRVHLREKDAHLNSWTQGSICRSFSLHRSM